MHAYFSTCFCTNREWDWLTTYKFWNVEYVLSKQDSHAHFDRPLFFLISRHFTCWGVCQELQARLVEVLLVFLASVVVCEDFTESGVDFRVDVALLLHLVFHFFQDLQAVVVQTQVQLLFSLSNSAQVDSIFEILKSCFSLIKEFNWDIDIGMLTRGQDCEYCVLDWVELVSQAFDHRFVKNKQVFVLCGVKSLVLEVADEFVSDLMPKPI